ncbi:ATP dependent DNA ligase, partial [Pseudokineococcus marinus]|nr:hypothetical protein [Pseudokineococcus marinus]
QPRRPARCHRGCCTGRGDQRHAGARDHGATESRSAGLTDSRGAVWVEPALLAEVRSLGSTTGGRLRQPSYVGLREDAEPDVVDAATVEAGVAASAQGHGGRWRR